MMKKSKMNLLTTASLATLGALVSQGAVAGDIVGVATSVDATNNTMSGASTVGNGITIQEGGGGAQTLTWANGDITMTGSGKILSDFNDVEVIVTAGDDTTLDLVMSGTANITSDQTSTGVLDINHNTGTLTVGSGTKIDTTGENGDVITLATGKSIAKIDVTGTIDADGSGEAIKLEAGTGTITSGIVVNSGGRIHTVTGAAIQFLGTTTADITNAGTIDATGAGTAIDIGDAVADDLTGTITNTGTIQAVAGTAIDIGADVSGGITNSGLITDSTGTAINFTGAGSTDLTNSGTISATGDGVAVAVTAATTGTFTNSGTITAVQTTDGEATFDINADILTGGLTNSGTISATGNDANAVALMVNSDMTTTITNTGTISATGAANGIAIEFTKDASLTNSGSIISTHDTAILVTTENTGTITNSGTITSTANAGAGEGAIQLSADLTLLTNTGTITVTGSGTTIDYATNELITLTNSTGTISSGTGDAIDLDNDDGGAGGTITNGGTITTASTDANEAALNITGASKGTITNTGTISATGGASASAIDVGAAFTGALTNTAGLITSNGTVGTILATADADITGDITNTGTISNTSTGPAIDYDAQTTAGNTITITNSGTISTATSTNTAISLGDTNVLTNSGTITGGIVAPNASAETLNWNGGIITGTIDLGNTGQADNDTINIGDASTDSITTGGAISGTETVTVKQGTFNVGHNITLTSNAIGNETFTINSGATTSITDDITLNSGVVAINGSLSITNAKTLTIESGGNGEYATANGAKITLGITKNSDFGKIVATEGTPDFDVITGTTLHFDTEAGSEAITAGTLTDVLAADDIQVDGTTATSTTYGTALTITDDSYVLGFAVASTSDGTGLDIAITRDNPYNNASSLANVSAVGTALESIANSGDSDLDAIVGALDAMSSAAEVTTALKTLNPDMSGATAGAAAAAASAATSVVGNRMSQLAGISGSSVATGGDSYNSGIWGEVYGTAADQGERKGVRGYQADTGGFALGVDTHINEQTQAGVSFAYSNTDADSANGTSEIDSYQIAGYGTYDLGKWYTEALIGYTFSSIDAKRNIVVGAISNQASADFDGDQFTAKVGLGYKMDIEGGLNVTPVGSLKYNYQGLDSYTETGSTANLTVDNDDLHVFESDLGVKLNYPIVDGSITYIPEISASWTYDYVGDEQTSANNFTGATGTTFTTAGADIAQHAFNVGLGLDVLAQDNLTVSLDYDWKSKEDYNSHSGSLKARFAF